MEGIIYMYTSPSGKKYIGQTVDELKRRWTFKSSYSYGGKKIDNARKKYGPENFEYKVLIRVTGDTKEEIKKYLNPLEIGLIRMYDTYSNGYNLDEGGKGISGYHHTEEQKKHHSEIMKGRTGWWKGKSLSDETKKKMSEVRKGHPTSDETKKKMSEARKGIIYSEETRKKMSEARKGKEPGNKGKQMTDEQKKKMSEARKGRHWKMVDGKRVWY